MGKPSVNTSHVADEFTAGNEKIIAVTNGRRATESPRGALICLHTNNDGTWCIEIFHADPGVEVRVAQSPGVRTTMITPASTAA